MHSEQIKAWAVSRSIYMGGSVLEIDPCNRLSIKPQILNEHMVSFGNRKELVFTNENLLKLHRVGFSLPEIGFLMSHPFQALKKINLLRKIGSSLKANSRSKAHLRLLLAVGLEATAVHLNEDRKCRSIIGSEKGIVEFYLDGDPLPLASLYKKEGSEWTVAITALHKKAKVRISFKSVDVGIKSCLGQLNPQVCSALGDYSIDGYLPLMDKIGYCARITGHDLPILGS